MHSQCCMYRCLSLDVGVCGAMVAVYKRCCRLSVLCLCFYCGHYVLCFCLLFCLKRALVMMSGLCVSCAEFPPHLEHTCVCMHRPISTLRRQVWNPVCHTTQKLLSTLGTLCWFVLACVEQKLCVCVYTCVFHAKMPPVKVYM